MIPVRAVGLLRVFAEAGVLAPSDVHVASAIGRLGGESRPDVLLAVALAVRGVRTGSVCVDLGAVAEQVELERDEAEPQPGPQQPGPQQPGPQQPAPRPEDLPWPTSWPTSWATLAQSPVVALGPDGPWRPVRLVDGLLYLDRYWQQEQLVRSQLDERAVRPAPALDLRALPRLFPGPAPDRQRLAVEVAAGRWVSVITGGPGTGKTHTVARLLAVLLDQPGPPPRIALAAPTGKAAARLQESVQAQADALGLHAAGLPPELSAATLHRLLGWRPDSRSRFRHGPGNHLPYDVVVVDESSMVSLTMMARLLEAVRPGARLVLVGDPDQLTPVDAGAVLSDLVHRPAPVGAAVPTTFDAADLDDEERRQLRNGVVRLRVPHRFGASIGALAEAVRAGDADRALALLDSEPALERVEDVSGLRAEVVETARLLQAAARTGDAVAALELLGRHRLLCAHRHGPYGVSHWNDEVRGWTGQAGTGWHPGQPLLITANDYENGLYNGDTGVVVQTGDGLRAAFGRAAGPELLPLSRLSAVQTVHAMTVHRSQGSQYDAVSVLLPTSTSAILTRELLYTAVTRAARRVRVVGTEDAVRTAVGRQVVRASGLRRVVSGFSSGPATGGSLPTGAATAGRG